MAGFNGTGTFIRTYNWVNDKNNSINITASRVDTEDDGFATGLSSVVVKDGQQTCTARIPFAVGLSFAGASGMAPIGDLTTGVFQTGAAGTLSVKSIGTIIAAFTSTGLDSCVIGGTTPAAGAFTTITGTSSATLGANSGTIGSLALKGSTSGTTTVVPNVAAGSGTLTLPVATDTLVGKATTDTFTNKTYDTAGSGNVLKINGTTVSDKTGTGKVVLDTSPTIATASLGSSTATTQASNDSSTKLATTAFVNPASTQSQTGTMTLANGIIIKWGFVTPGSASANTVTFGAAFPNNAFVAYATVAGVSDGKRSAGIASLSTSAVVIWTGEGNAGSEQFPFYWLAIGN